MAIKERIMTNEIEKGPNTIVNTPTIETIPAKPTTEILVEEKILGPEGITKLLEKYKPDIRNISIDGKKPKRTTSDYQTLIDSIFRESYAFVEEYFDPETGTARLAFHNQNPIDRDENPFLTISMGLNPREYVASPYRQQKDLPQGGTVKTYPPILLSPNEIINILDKHGEPSQPIYTIIDVSGPPLTIGTKSKANPYPDRLRNEIIPEAGAVTQTKFEIDPETGQLICVVEFYHNAQEAKQNIPPYMRLERLAKRDYQVATVNDEGIDKNQEVIIDTEQRPQTTIKVVYPEIPSDEIMPFSISADNAERVDAYTQRMQRIIEHNLRLKKGEDSAFATDYEAQIIYAESLIVAIQIEVNQAIEQYKTIGVGELQPKASKKDIKRNQDKTRKGQQEATQKIKTILGIDLNPEHPIIVAYLTDGINGMALGHDISKQRPELAKRVMTHIAHEAQRNILESPLSPQEINTLLAYYESNGVIFKNENARRQAATIIFEAALNDETISSDSAQRSWIRIAQELQHKTEKARAETKKVNEEQRLAQQQLDDLNELVTLFRSNESTRISLGSELDELAAAIEILQNRNNQNIILVNNACSSITRLFTTLRKKTNYIYASFGGTDQLFDEDNNKNEAARRAFKGKNLDALKRQYSVDLSADAALETLRSLGHSINPDQETKFKAAWEQYKTDYETVNNAQTKPKEKSRADIRITTFMNTYNPEGGLMYALLTQSNESPYSELASDVQEQLTQIQEQIINQGLLAKQKRFLGPDRAPELFAAANQNADRVIAAFYGLLTARLKAVNEVYDNCAQAIARNTFTSQNPSEFENAETFGPWYPPKPKKEKNVEEGKKEKRKNGERPKEETWLAGKREIDLFNKLQLPSSALDRLSDLPAKVRTGIIEQLGYIFKIGSRIDPETISTYLENHRGFNQEEKRLVEEYIKSLPKKE